MSRKPNGPPRRAPFILLTCEHGGRDVPAEHTHLFQGAESALESHRGYDIGALGVAHHMAGRLNCPIIFSTVTRLLIDLNRSLDQPDTLSEYSRGLSHEERERLIEAYYKPHRENVTAAVDAAIVAGHTVVHIGVHSCVDRLDGNDRDLDIALLYDETRDAEAAFCDSWMRLMRARDGTLRYAFNEPYRGSDDGLTTSLRSRFDPDRYLGIEVELRQGFIPSAEDQRRVGEHLATTLLQASNAVARPPST